ncbi:MAG: FAD-dependent oxidoreductase [Zavarzinia sp.]|nr:FAD-dependent oxidoreductase [Zavarzinia sp.]
MDYSRRSFLTTLGTSTFLLGVPSAWGASARRFQVVVYGASFSGLFAAYAAAREGMKVALVAGPTATGGVTANGLGHSDVTHSKSLEDNKLGGLTARFYKAMGKVYGKPYSYQFEPHAALKFFLDVLDESNVPFFQREFDERRPLLKEGTAIKSLFLEDGTQIDGDVFIDCTYEGDLMAAAGVLFEVGRDSRKKFGESMAGFGVAQRVVSKIKARDSSGRLIPLIKPYPKRLAVGDADAGVMSYSYRTCLTNDPHDRIRFKKPPRYNADWYLLDLQRAISREGFHAGTTLAGTKKVDRNNDEPVGENWGYTLANRAQRKAITDFHKTYAAGRLYFYGNDPRVPKYFRDSINEWGLASSEFEHSGNWPRQMYIRESRRLWGMYKLKQQDLNAGAVFSDAMLSWSYGIDGHSVQYLEGPNGEMIIEGARISDVEGYKSIKRYQVPMRAFLPDKNHCTNLIVPVCASVSRIANCSYRMEPAYMKAGEAAGIIAARAVQGKSTVQRVDASGVRSRLLNWGAII